MNVCVLGATGFIGYQLVKRLQEVGSLKIAAVSRNVAFRPTQLDQEISWFRGDLSSLELCRRIAETNRIIVHLAHSNYPLDSDMDLPGDILSNGLINANLLQAIRDSQREPHLIFASSAGSVYGDSTSMVGFRETDPCLPRNNYGIQKLAMENYLRVWGDRGHLTSTVLRIANAYGVLLPAERRQGLIGVSMRRILDNKPIKIIGNPDNVRDYIHIDDVIDAIMIALGRRSAFEVFNIGSGQGFSVSEVIAKIERQTGTEAVKELDTLNCGADLIKHCVVNCEKAAGILNWKPRITLDQGIAMMHKDWLGNNR